MKLVIIQWIDSTTLGERWLHNDETEDMDTNDCTAVGFIVSEDKRKIVLAQATCPKNDSVINLLGIPKGCIKSIKNLK